MTGCAWCSHTNTRTSSTSIGRAGTRRWRGTCSAVLRFLFRTSTSPPGRSKAWRPTRKAPRRDGAASTPATSACSSPRPLDRVSRSTARRRIPTTGPAAPRRMRTAVSSTSTWPNGTVMRSSPISRAARPGGSISWRRPPSRTPSAGAAAFGGRTSQRRARREDRTPGGRKVRSA